MKQKRMGMGQFTIYQEKVCEECPNVKLESSDEELEIEIERGQFDFNHKIKSDFIISGMDHGHEINYYGEGEPMIDGEAGDLMVKLR